jgi:hypothetical protein
MPEHTKHALTLNNTRQRAELTSSSQAPLAAQSQTNTMNEWSTRNGTRLGRSINLAARSKQRPVTRSTIKVCNLAGFPAQSADFECRPRASLAGLAGDGCGALPCRVQKSMTL